MANAEILRIIVGVIRTGGSMLSLGTIHLIIFVIKKYVSLFYTFYTNK